MPSPKRSAKPKVDDPTLHTVARAAQRNARTRSDLENAIRASYAAGMSLRNIAAAAGISHEAVRLLCRDLER